MKKKLTPKKAKTLAHFDEVDVSTRFDDVYESIRPGKLAVFSQNHTSFSFTCTKGVELQIDVLADHLFRVRYKARGTWEPDFSYAISPAFKAVEPIFLEVIDSKKHLEIRTGKLICLIIKNGLKINFEDAEGQVLLQDKKGFQAYSTILKGTCDLSVDKKLDSKTSYFGLGDKAGALQLNGRRFENWNTDSFAYGNDTDPLYKSIPFTVGHKKGKWFGIFLDNTCRTYFDFGFSKSKNFRFGAAGGEMNYYFFSGVNSNEIARTYAELTGKPELPASWMLGFHQCRWSYFPEKRFVEIAEEFRRRKIPCDALYLDIDYMDDYRCFTWNKAHFPDPKGMIQNLEEKGFKTVVMIDPGLKVDPDYKVYKEGLEKDYFCKRTSGKTMIGPVWPGNCVFPDFTREEVRQWWGKLYEELYLEQGVHGFWNDMNEPAVFKINHKTFPDAVIHHYDGNPTDHSKAHNIYGQQMVRATQQGLKRLKPEKRPLVITRATYAGGQRYSFAWTGDNIASWEHLRLASTQCQRMSLSGFSLVGSDIGGFVDVPTPELMIRWTQLAVFHPFFRIHSMGNNEDGAAGPETDLIREKERLNRLDQEPWSFGPKAEKNIRKAIELRYRILPYLYTLCKELADIGTPVLRSLVLENPDELRFKGWDEAFFVGDNLLVFPICQPDINNLKIPLPDGIWYRYYNGKGSKLKKGFLKIKTSIKRIPIFVRAGAIIPHYPLRQYTAEAKPDYLKLKAYFAKGTEISKLYEDLGEGYEYKDGNFLIRTFLQEGKKKSWTLRQNRQGNFQESYSQIRLELAGLPFKPSKVIMDGNLLDFRYKKGIVRSKLLTQFNFLEIC